MPNRTGGVPDARWINRELKIGDVAAKLGCRLAAHNKIHCWHPEKHQHGDRTASVGIHVRANRLKCFGFGCDSKLMSVVDLVMDFRGVNVSEAVQWLDTTFPGIPRIPKGRHLAERDRPRLPVGAETPLELLVRCGIFGRLQPAARIVFPVLLSFATKDEKGIYHVRLSYRAIMRYSGLKSHTGVSAALGELKAWSLLQSLPAAGASPPIRPAAAYMLTPYSDEFQELANAIAGENRAAIEIERERRRFARAERNSQIQEQKRGRGDDSTEYKPL